VDLVAQRKTALTEHIVRQQRLLHEWEQARDLSSDPKVIARANHEIQTIRESIASYEAELACVAPGGGPRVGTASGPIRILFATATPDDEAWLRVDREMRLIQAQLRQSAQRDRFTFDVRMAVRPEDLTQALHDLAPNIVHFSGHGGVDGAVYLEDGQGQAHPVAPDALEALFALVKDRVSCVLLNACYSRAQAEAIVRHVPHAIGMSREIPDDAAIAFAVGFYQALGAGESIARAFDFGVVQLRLQNLPDHLTPMLCAKNQ
jgi:hypothetical protein